MANEKYKPQVPDIMEAIFDAGYFVLRIFKGQSFVHLIRRINIDALRR